MLLPTALAADRGRALLASITALLPGRYQLDGGGADISTRFELRVMPIFAPQVGERVFYLAEYAADEPERITRQVILALVPAKRREQVLSALLVPREPLRWRAGLLEPELFKSMVMDDLRPASSCDSWLWQREGKTHLLGASPTRECGPVGMRVNADGLQWGAETLGFYRRIRGS
jgi:hypothetical protein